MLFDLDNTLYEGRGFARHVILGDIRHCFLARRERKARRALAGQDFSTMEALQRALAHLVARGGNEQRVFDWYRTRCVQNMAKVLRNHYTARPGAEAAIAKMREQGAMVGVLSDYPLTQERLEALGLGALQLPTWSCEELATLKPSPKAFIEVCRQVGVKPEETMVVGDKADTDAAGALSAGCRCLLVEGKHAQNDLGVEVLPWEGLLQRLIEQTRNQ